MWFDVDKAGLAKLLERRGRAFVINELIQNAWDEQTRRVTVTLSRIGRTRRARLCVEDDNPAGFADLSHAFTLFAESNKKTDPLRRGRYNLGEKMILALCDEAEISSTTGTIRFEASGYRRLTRKRRAAGSRFAAVLCLTDAELAECALAAQRLIPPAGIETWYNGAPLAPRQALAEFRASLPTEVADAAGVLRRTTRQAIVRVHATAPGEEAALYELGIPVCDTGDRWHIDVAQKVPLGFERDNVPHAYLARLRAAVLEHMAGHITADDAASGWVRDAFQRHGHHLSQQTVQRVLSLRFGERRVAFDPSDQEANLRAAAEGYTVVHGAQLSKSEWETARRCAAMPPAGQVTPTPKPFVPGGAPLKTIPPSQWDAAQVELADYAKRLARRLLGVELQVTIANDAGWPFSAAYGDARLVLNLGRLGRAWFGGPLAPINALLLHEFGHHTCANHLDPAYHRALCRLGAALAQLGLVQPTLFPPRPAAGGPATAAVHVFALPDGGAARALL